VSRDQSVEGRTDGGEWSGSRQSRQPTPTGEFTHDSPPGGEAFQQGTVIIPNPHGSFMLSAGGRQVIVTLAAKVDEPDPRAGITQLAPIPRRLAQLALTIHPDLQSGFRVDLRLHSSSLRSNADQGA
jgi:hypothetical protein